MKNDTIPERVPHSRTREQRPRDGVWQKKLLPFMVITFSILTLFFFIASLIQIHELNKRIDAAPALDLTAALSRLRQNPAKSEMAQLEQTKWDTLSTLEENALKQRYHQANVLLLSRVWTRYIGFVTGMVLAMIGAVFIMGKMRESEAQVAGGGSLWKFSITSASPGLVLAVLGSVLMVTTILTQYPITVNDVPLYLVNQSTSGRPAEIAGKEAPTTNGGSDEGPPRRGTDVDRPRKKEGLVRGVPRPRVEGMPPITQPSRPIGGFGYPPALSNSWSQAEVSGYYNYDMRPTPTRIAEPLRIPAFKLYEDPFQRPPIFQLSNPFGTNPYKLPISQPTIPPFLGPLQRRKPN